MSTTNNGSNESSSWLDRLFDWINSIDLSPSTREWLEEYNKASDNFGNGYIGGNFGGF